MGVVAALGRLVQDSAAFVWSGRGSDTGGTLGDTVASFVCGSYVQGAGVAGQIRGYRGVFSA